MMKTHSRKSLLYSPFLIALSTLFIAASGFAETSVETPEESPAAAETPEEVHQQALELGVIPEVSPLNDPAWQLYHQAFIEVLRDHHDAAESLLNQLIQEYPDHGATPLAHRILAVISLVEPGKSAASDDTRAPAASETPQTSPAYQQSGQPPTRTLANGESTSAQARAELVIFQTLHGITVGFETCTLLDCNSPATVFGSLTAGAALGLGGSLYLTRNGITPGQASSFNTGTYWGFWNGLTLAQALNLEGKAYGGTILAGQALGLGGAALAWHLFEPTAGNVSLASSGAIWTTVVTALIHGIAGNEADDGVFWGSLMAASSVGLVGGAILSTKYPVSRGRALVIDSGGILGALAGFSAYLIITNGEGSDATAAWTSGLVGVVGGLAAATYFSRNWDVETDKTAQLFVAPTDGGALVGLGGRF